MVFSEFWLRKFFGLLNMDRSREPRRHGKDPVGDSGQNDREEKIIWIPKFDFSDLIKKYKTSLVGRMFHTEGRSIDALLAFMLRSRIWDVEGRVHGSDMGNGRFQFDFKEEKDLQKVLRRRPCHFNR